MRIRPNGVELLRAARGVIETAIVPELPDARRPAVREIGQTLARAEDRLARDDEASVAELAMLERARVTMRGEVLEALPEERRYDARLIAKAIAVATRQLANGYAPERREYARLAALLGAPAEIPEAPQDMRCTLARLNERLGEGIRAGEADLGTTACAQTFAHLEAITHEALSESNPGFLRRTGDRVSPDSRVTESPAECVRPVATALAAWCDVPSAFLRIFPIDVTPAPISARIDAWLNLNGAVGGAVCASSSAALAKQADLFGWFAQRLAANSRVPMAVVEGAHQAHDLAVSIAEANAEFCAFALAPLRRVRPGPANAARLPS